MKLHDHIHFADPPEHDDQDESEWILRFLRTESAPTTEDQPCQPQLKAYDPNN